MSGSCALNAQGTRPLASSWKKGLVGSTVEVRGMISGSGQVKVLDAMSLVQPVLLCLFTPTPILKLFAGEVLNRVETKFDST